MYRFFLGKEKWSKFKIHIEEEPSKPIEDE